PNVAVAYRKSDATWAAVPVPPAQGAASRTTLQIRLEQDMNTPPRLVALDPPTQRKALLLDPNPQFKQLEFGEVEEIRWKATDGRSSEGGLYRPPHFE